MTPTRFRSLVRQALQRGGFAPRNGSALLWKNADVAWVVALDRSPVAPRYTLEIGTSLDVEPAQRPNDCPMFVHLENLSPAGVGADFRDRLLRAFDLSYEMDDSARKQEVDWVLAQATSYLTGLGDVAEVKRRYLAGEFDSAFIDKKTRERLTS